MSDQIRNRIVGYETIDAAQLRPSPRNWRRHPPRQLDALEGSLDEIGWAQPLLVREVTGAKRSRVKRYELIDGEARFKIAGDQKLPVIVLDVSEEEADKLLAILDPLSAMATADPDALRQLIESLDTGSEALEQMLQELLAAETPEFEPVPADTQGELDRTMTQTVTCPNCQHEFQL